MKNQLLYWFFFFFAILAGFQHSLSGSLDCGSGKNLSPQLRSWVELYETGWQGDDDALREFFEVAAKLAKSTWKREPLLRAVYGSACIAHSRLVSDYRKPHWLRLGAGHLNAAVAAAAPEETAPRFLRAVSFAVLPRRAGQMETVRADFDLLVKAAEADRLSEDCRQRIFYQAGALALRDRDPRALALLRRAVELNPEGGLEREQLLRMLRMAEQQVEK